MQQFLFNTKTKILFPRIQIDYSGLSDHLKDLEEKDEIKKMADKLLNSIKSLQDTLTKIQAPNMKVCIYIYFLT